MIVADELKCTGLEAEGIDQVTEGRVQGFKRDWDELCGNSLNDNLKDNRVTSEAFTNLTLCYISEIFSPARPLCFPGSIARKFA
ncbi:MAG: hypothetical protein CTY22_00740 [Methylomonas sp.]|nr:MAG: hypothetical protein CTY23_01855 [Methylomonas sp.]PPD27963.1 MAG: hypothetical protein CTY22_00740 [Methylomonas sp.]PPD40072.1 MAG: hypothetical protein CTY21_00735 [Methylomonas sp.]